MPMTTVTIDLADEVTAVQSLRVLDSAQRDRILQASQEILSAEREQEIVAVIRQVLADSFPPPGSTGRSRQSAPVGVLFLTSEYDNGYFLGTDGTVVFDNGATAELDFEDLNEVFSDEYGVCGSNFTLAVDLRTDEIDADDHGEDSVHRRFRIPQPGHQEAHTSQG